MSAPNMVGTICVKEENTKEWTCDCVTCEKEKDE